MRIFLNSLLVTLGLMVPFEVFTRYSGVTDFYTSLINGPLLSFFSLIGLYIYFKKIETLQIKTTWLQKIVTLIFSVCTWLTSVYDAGLETINKLLVGNLPGLLYSLIYLISFYLLIESFQKILTILYYKKQIWTFKWPTLLSKILELFSRNPFIFSFLFLITVYTSILIISYPGVFMGDSFDQIKQFLGYEDKSAAHPVLSSLFIGACVKLGIFLGSANLGIFIFTFSQLLILTLTISFSIHLLVTYRQQKHYAFFALLLFAILPSIQGTILLATKDILYSAFFLLFMTILAIYFYNKSDYHKSHYAVIYFIAIVLMMLFRYNTLHFIVLMLVIYIISAFSMRLSIFNLKSIVPLTVLALISGSLINTFIVDNYVDVQPKPNRREMLSLPFQHTARYIRYHENDISEVDKKIINDVLDYELIKENYNPYRSDPVKRTHNEKANSTQMAAYFKLVLRQAATHPLLAFESVAVSHANLFNLNISQNDYYRNSLSMDDDSPETQELYAEIGLKDSPTILRINKLRVTIYRLWDRLPILSQLNNYGSFIFLLFAMFSIYIRDKKYVYAGILIPLFTFLATLIAGPITIGYIRYMLPIILSVLITFGFFLSTNKKDFLD